MTDDTFDLNYECTGSGPDALLIHGFASSIRMWDPLVSGLSDYLRCWAVDLPGFGDSPLPDDPALVFDMPYHVGALLDFCTRHDIRPAVVMGHSMGGLLALLLAHQQPTRAPKLVLLSPVITGQTGMHFTMFQQVFGGALRGVVHSQGERLFRLAQANVIRWMLGAVSPNPAVEARKSRDVQRMRWRAALGAMEGMGQTNVVAHLPTITAPTLIITGSRDFTVPPTEGALAAAKMPNALLVEQVGVFHQPLDEQPDRTVQSIRVFLDIEGQRNSAKI